jgi:hypothetical protein
MNTNLMAAIGLGALLGALLMTAVKYPTAELIQLNKQVAGFERVVEQLRYAVAAHQAAGLQDHDMPLSLNDGIKDGKLIKVE